MMSLFRVHIYKQSIRQKAKVLQITAMLIRVKQSKYEFSFVFHTKVELIVFKS